MSTLGEDGPVRTDLWHQSFCVDFQYPVVFTEHVFAPHNPALADLIDRRREARQHRVMAFIDEGLAAAQPGLADAMDAYAAAHAGVFKMDDRPRLVPGGERAKNSWTLVGDLLSTIGRRHLCRQSVVLAVGGGSTLDIVGLVAALAHRGVRLIRVPTSVLSQNDAGVGVKNGIDFEGMKNFAGAFAPPFGVLIDPTFLKTLPDSYWYGGLAEAFKVAIITDRALFDELRACADALGHRDETVMAAVVKRSAVRHLEHIRDSGDPFEFGEARPLDFGHWSAHRLEILSDYKLGHGQCVGVGVALDTFYAWAKGYLTADERDDIVGTMRRAGVRIWTDLLEARGSDGQMQLLRGLEDFREHLGGRLNVTLPCGIGNKIEVHEMDADLIAQGVAWLRAGYRTTGQSDGSRH